MVVETGRQRDSKPLHYVKARPVNDRKVLIAERTPDRPGVFEVCRGYQLNMHAASSNAIPKLFGYLAAVTPVQQ